MKMYIKNSLINYQFIKYTGLTFYLKVLIIGELTF